MKEEGEKVKSGFPEMLEYEIAENGEGLVVPPDTEPLDFLLAIMRDPRQPMARRQKAATDAAQYRHPKLGAIADTNISGETFAAMFDRAIERSGKGREVKQIEAEPMQFSSIYCPLIFAEFSHDQLLFGNAIGVNGKTFRVEVPVVEIYRERQPRSGCACEPPFK